MKKIILPLVLFAFTWLSGKDQVRDWFLSQKQVNAFSGEFLWEVENDLFAQTQTQKGNFGYQKPEKFLLSILGESPYQLYFKEKSVWIKRGNRKAMPFNAPPVFREMLLSLFSGDIFDGEQFEISWKDEVKRIALLKPKKNTKFPWLESLLMDFMENNAFCEKIIFNQKDGNKTSLFFKQLKIEDEIIWPEWINDLKD